MAKLVECVPNFSEGRNKEVIDAIANAISTTDGCSLLDVDPGTCTNRTVYTFVGPPEAVVEGALSAARTAFSTIDMAKHTGEHPRMGAMDVCPFIPVRNVTMDDCVACAHEFGRRLADVLQVPVYLYGEAARSESRRALPSVRAGEYEALPEKLEKSEWAPDYGPATFVPSWGATVTGARTFLIAYNVNLLSTKEQAHRVALDIREQGRGPGRPGLLKKVQGMGWYLEDSSLAQVSTNILDFQLTPLHTVWEEICRVARELKLPVVGSQIVGLMPVKAVLDSADFYIQKEKLFIIEEQHKVRLVISKLGLDSLGPFVPEERIIEYVVEANQDKGQLVSLPLQQFVRSVGARTAAPGGGSVSAAIAAMGAALGCMVGQMTYGKRQFEAIDGVMRRLIPPFHQAMNDLLLMVDADSTAFNSYMAALKMPRTTEDDMKRREEAMQERLKKAVGVPLSLAERVTTLWPALCEMVQYGNVACDLGDSSSLLSQVVHQILEHRDCSVLLSVVLSRFPPPTSSSCCFWLGHQGPGSCEELLLFTYSPSVSAFYETCLRTSLEAHSRCDIKYKKVSQIKHRIRQNCQICCKNLEGIERLNMTTDE